MGDRSGKGSGSQHADRAPRAVQVAAREAPSIHRALVRAGVTPADAEDLLQAAVVVAWQGFCVGGDLVLPEDDREAGKVMRAFLAVVAFRTRGKGSRVSRALLLVDPPEQAAPSCEDAYVARAMLRRLETTTTPERWRVLVGDAEGAEGPELAEQERIPVNTVYCRLRLAREDVATAMARDRVAYRGARPRLPRK